MSRDVVEIITVKDGNYSILNGLNSFGGELNSSAVVAIFLNGQLQAGHTPLNPRDFWPSNEWSEEFEEMIQTPAGEIPAESPSFMEAREVETVLSSLGYSCI